VQPASAEAATPSAPPRAEVPKAVEESPQSSAPIEDLPAPDADAATSDADGDVPMRSEIPAPADEPRADEDRDASPPRKPALPAEPDADEPAAAEPKPAAKPAAPATKEKDLFDDASSSATSWRSFTAAARRQAVRP
jgi:hypothetical protein